MELYHFNKTKEMEKEIETYEKILGEEFRLKKLFKSPFREENKPSLSFYISKNGNIRWKDFGSDEASGNIYDFVSKYLNTKDLKKIKEFIKGTVTYENKNSTLIKWKPTIKKNIEIKIKDWDDQSKKYWEQYGINKKILKSFNVFLIKHFYINGILYKSDPETMRFAEVVNQNVKIYTPLSKTKKDKWFSSCVKDDIFGEEQLKYKEENLIITKSLKDVMSLYAMGYEAISPMSETVDLPARAKNILNKYKNIYILYDNDETGLKRGKIMALKYNAKNIILPNESKDISDTIKNEGIDKAKEIINKYINK